MLMPDNEQYIIYLRENQNDFKKKLTLVLKVHKIFY